MESIKRKWGKPGSDVQVFTPEEYCQSCWLVMCNWYGCAYKDLNGSQTFDNINERVHSNESHAGFNEVVLGDDEEPSENCKYNRSGIGIQDYYWVPGELFGDRVKGPLYYSDTRFFQPAFWFKSRGASKREHINSLAPGTYKRDPRPNHS